MTSNTGHGVFITLEGPEGGGKTTQTALLVDRLCARGYDVLRCAEPGGGPIPQAIRAVLLSPSHAEMVPRSELLLFLAARAQHVEETIRPALAAGRIVICDRYSDSTIAYQSSGGGLPREQVEALIDFAAGGLWPDLTLLLDVPAEVGLAEFGRPAGFLERQLRRWSKQWEATKIAELPALDALRDELVRTLPEQPVPSIVHGSPAGCTPHDGSVASRPRCTAPESRWAFEPFAFAT